MGVGFSNDVFNCVCSMKTETETEEVEEGSMSNFKMHTIESIDSSSIPQLITARACPKTDILKSPTGNKCLHYHVIAEELITTGKDKDGMIKRQYVYRFDETNSVDFYLADPQSPGKQIFVPGIEKSPINRYTCV